MIKRFRWNIFEFTWRLNFTGQMIEKTRCSFWTGWQFSKETQEMHPYWFDAEPSDVADFQIETRLRYMRKLSTKKEIDQWFKSTAPGEIACYGVANELIYPSSEIMTYVNKYYQRGEMLLFQKRQQDGSFHYLMSKAKGEKNVRSRTN